MAILAGYDGYAQGQGFEHRSSDAVARWSADISKASGQQRQKLVVGEVPQQEEALALLRWPVGHDSLAAGNSLEGKPSQMNPASGCRCRNCSIASRNAGSRYSGRNET